MRLSAATIGVLALAVVATVAVPQAVAERDGDRAATAVPTTPADAQLRVVREATASGSASVAPAKLRTGYSKKAAAADANWILRAQLPNGAIATHLDRRHVYPYLGNFAAIGLARATTQTGDRRYVKAAWRHLSWYAAHQDRHGYVTDYTVGAGGRVRSTGTMDSTDAYAGTYLLAVRAAYRASGDKAKLRALKPSLAKAVSAIRSTQDRDGLTWAKPTWRVKYLMDQAETLAGLRAAAYLGARVGDAALVRTAAASASRLQKGVDSLWNPRTGSYDWAKHANGVRVATNWKRLYPDAMQQSWAVAFGAVPAARGRAIMRTFERRQANWDEPRRTARYDSGTRRVGYWAPVGLAMQRAGRAGAGVNGFATIRSSAVGQKRAWPFTPSDSGQLIVLGNGALSDFTP